MRKLTETLGNEMWTNAVIVLTFAQDIEAEAKAKVGSDQSKKK